MRSEPGAAEEEPGAAEDQPRVVLITAPDLAIARALARGLVTRRLAACVNLVEGVTSIYRWEGELHEEAEVLLVVKTRASQLGALHELLEREHPYDVPELVALEPAHVAPAYLRWLLDSTSDGGAEE